MRPNNPLIYLHLGFVFLLIIGLSLFAGNCLDQYYHKNGEFLFGGIFLAFILIFYIIWTVMKRLQQKEG